jgi:hypothetical protein
MSQCKYCGKQIEWGKRGDGKPAAFTPGTTDFHKCKQFKERTPTDCRLKKNDLIRKKLLLRSQISFHLERGQEVPEKYLKQQVALDEEMQYLNGDYQ